MKTSPLIVNQKKYIITEINEFLLEMTHGGHKKCPYCGNALGEYRFFKRNSSTRKRYGLRQCFDCKKLFKIRISPHGITNKVIEIEVIEVK